MARILKTEVYEPFMSTVERAGFKNLKELSVAAQVPYMTVIGYAGLDTQQRHLESIVKLADKLDISIEALVMMLIEKGYSKEDHKEAI